MANEINSPAVPLFQRAHSRILTLHRVDEQLTALLQQRSRIQDELKSIQSQINSEFERVTAMDEEAPAKVLSTISEIAKGGAARAAEMQSQPIPQATALHTDVREEPVRPAPSRARRVMVAEKAAGEAVR